VLAGAALRSASSHTIAALHLLAIEALTDELREQLTEVVHGYTGPCDEATARLGLEWKRERDRGRGQAPPF
jgi:hypothetical protein